MLVKGKLPTKEHLWSLLDNEQQRIKGENHTNETIDQPDIKRENQTSETIDQNDIKRENQTSETGDERPTSSSE